MSKSNASRDMAALLSLELAEALLFNEQQDLDVDVSSIQSIFADRFSRFYAMHSQLISMSSDLDVRHYTSLCKNIAKIVSKDIDLAPEDLQGMVERAQTLTEEAAPHITSLIDSKQHPSVSAGSAILCASLKIKDLITEIPMGQDVDIAFEYLMGLVTELSEDYAKLNASGLQDRDIVDLFSSTLPVMTQLVCDSWVSAAISELNPQNRLPSKHTVREGLERFKGYVSSYDLGHAATVDILLEQVSEYIDSLSSKAAIGQTFIRNSNTLSYQVALSMFLAKLAEGSWRQSVNKQLLELDKMLDDEDMAIKWLNTKGREPLSLTDYFAVLESSFRASEPFTKDADFEIDIVQRVAKERASLLVGASDAITQEAAFWR